MEQIRLVYASVVKGTPPNFDQLAALLRHSSKNNALLGVTGILCYARGAFLQVLEGERSVVNRLYRTISADPRHQECEIVTCTSITARAFAEWAMQLVAMEVPADVELHRMAGEDAERFLAGCAAQERKRQHAA